MKGTSREELIHFRLLAIDNQKAYNSFNNRCSGEPRSEKRIVMAHCHRIISRSFLWAVLSVGLSTGPVHSEAPVTEEKLPAQVSTEASETDEPEAQTSGDSPDQAEVAGVVSQDENVPSNEEISASLQVLEADNASVLIAAEDIQPRRLRVRPGTTIAWINRAEGPVVVQFTGKAVSTTCKAPRGFTVGNAGVYVSNEIPPGEVASLCFLEPELYVYEISYVSAEASESAGNSTDTRLLVGSIQVVK